MTIRRSYERALKKENTEDRKRLNKVLSKQKLKNVISKKFQTCFIGAIDSVENHMSALWSNKDDKELTKFQISMLSRWKVLRTEILDKGNTQLRAVLKELEYYDVDWDGGDFDIRIGE